LAQSIPDRIIGLHLSASNPFIFQLPADLSETELLFVDKSRHYVVQEGANGMEQSTKPQTLAFGLNDSPVGSAA